MSALAPPTDPLPRAEFSLSQARKIVGDLFAPNPWIFWADFLASWLLGVVAMRMVREYPLGSPMQVLLFVVSGLMIFRASIFTHELVHLRAGTFRAFRIVWNLLAGIPFLIPSFTYYTHIDHHRRRLFGTRDDGEYLPFATRGPREIFIYLLQIPVVPALAVVRFGVLTPLTWFSTALRDWAIRHASSMITDPMYIRPLPSRRTLRLIRVQELACFLFIWGFAAVTIARHTWWFVIPQAYATGMFVIAVNAIRTLGAHRYTNDEREMTFVEQLLDSVNYTNRSWFAPLWAPVGLQYHALHHIFPTMPYHALGAAHQRLMRELPADSPYRLTESDSLTAELRLLWQRACATQKADRELVQQRAA